MQKQNWSPQQTQTTNSATHQNWFSESSNTEFMSQHTFTELSKLMKSIDDRSDLFKLQDDVENIKRLLQDNQQNLKKIGPIDKFKCNVNDILQLLENYRIKKEEQRKNLKYELLSGIKELEQAITQMMKRWKQIKLQTQQSIRKQIQGLEHQFHSDCRQLKDFHKMNKNKMRQNMNQLQLTIKEVKKEQILKKKNIKQELQSLKTGFNRILRIQTEQRKIQNTAIFKLLQETCEHANKAMRRRIY